MHAHNVEKEESRFAPAHHRKFLIMLRITKTKKNQKIHFYVLFFVTCKFRKSRVAYCEKANVSHNNEPFFFK